MKTASLILVLFSFTTFGARMNDHISWNDCIRQAIEDEVGFYGFRGAVVTVPSRIFVGRLSNYAFTDFRAANPDGTQLTGEARVELTRYYIEFANAAQMAGPQGRYEKECLIAPTSDFRTTSTIFRLEHPVRGLIRHETGDIDVREGILRERVMP